MDYLSQRMELSDKYGELQKLADNLTDRRVIMKQYLSASINLALEHGRKEHAAELQEVLDDTIRMEKQSLAIELKLKEVEREFNKLMLMQKGMAVQ
ncbi:hypothetical protein BABA_02182 [Neobacillus bataviensis LMG 21833]|uniref:Uncharacterized protein n=1 Tax=Neobacillus bataviensis LMG 21833 TaxID=1117379 RepID=K6DFH1_9BACI|nr:hypothetical protein [Neobacillus bataviensis]EKN71302.1 hypothetical protein BABA_02182 [Neobacillus bataviensis LMG 21833]